MPVALATVFDTGAVESILSLYATRPDVEWETVYGPGVIWQTKHIVTYGWGP